MIICGNIVKEELEMIANEKEFDIIFEKKWNKLISKIGACDSDFEIGKKVYQIGDETYIARGYDAHHNFNRVEYIRREERKVYASTLYIYHKTKLYKDQIKVYLLRGWDKEHELSLIKDRYNELKQKIRTMEKFGNPEEFLNNEEYYDWEDEQEEEKLDLLYSEMNNVYEEMMKLKDEKRFMEILSKYFHK